MAPRLDSTSIGDHGLASRARAPAPAPRPALFQHLQQAAPALAGRILVGSGDLSQPDTTVFLERTGALALLKPYANHDLLEALRRMCVQPSDESTTRPTPHQEPRRAIS